MINSCSFLILNKNEQIEIVQSGIYLAERREGSLQVKLYSLDEFYLEVFLDLAKGTILELRSFNLGAYEKLVPYLQDLIY